VNFIVVSWAIPVSRCGFGGFALSDKRCTEACPSRLVNGNDIGAQL